MVSTRDIRAMRRYIKKLDNENTNLITLKKRLERQISTQNFYIELFLHNDETETDTESEDVLRPRLWH